MSDWRSKPRTGKSVFMQSVSEISSRLAMGETQKQIYDDLITKGMTLSYSQFNRYVKMILISNEEQNRTVIKRNNIVNGVSLSKQNNDKENNNDNDSINNWHSINVTRLPLINRLEENGFTPDEVKEWGLANENQISKKLTELLIKRGK